MSGTEEPATKKAKMDGGKVRKIGTHNGAFHADDALVSAGRREKGSWGRWRVELADIG